MTYLHGFIDIMKEIIEALSTAGWINVFGTIGVALVLVLLFVAQFTKADGFDLRDLVADRNLSGKFVLNRSKFFQTGAFLVTSWGFAWLVLQNQLNELYLLIYSVSWIGSEAVNLLAKAKAGTMASGVTQETSKTETTSTTIPPSPPIPPA